MNTSDKYREDLKHDKEYACSIYNKYKSIRTHTRNFSIISFLFALVLFVKFVSLWYVYVPFIVIGLILLIVRSNYKFQYDVASVVFNSVLMFEEFNKVGITDPDEMFDFIEKKSKELDKKEKGD